MERAELQLAAQAVLRTSGADALLSYIRKVMEDDLLASDPMNTAQLQAAALRLEAMRSVEEFIRSLAIEGQK